jgi:hypothetical protein
MAQDTPNLSEKYREYLKADSWKCETSPTNAHHWIEKHSEEGSSLFECRYCHMDVWFPSVFEADSRSFQKGILVKRDYHIYWLGR